MPGVVPAHDGVPPRGCAEAVRGGRARAGGLMLFGVPKEDDRTRSAPARIDPDGMLNRRDATVRGRRPGRRARSDGRHVPRRVHRPRALRRPRRPTVVSTTTRTLARYAEMARRAGSTPRRHVVGTERHDGRPGRCDPGGARRRRLRRRLDPRLLGEVRVRVLRARSARRSDRRWRATVGPTSRILRTDWSRSASSSPTSTRVRTW
jgi:hypothetical protein